jgi:hypothetical protein
VGFEPTNFKRHGFAVQGFESHRGHHASLAERATHGKPFL